MGKRLLLGPVLIAALVGLLALDQFLAGRGLPGGATLWGWDHVPRGFVLFFLASGVGILAARELAAILAEKGVIASKRILSGAAIVGLMVSCLIPEGERALNAVAIVSTSATLVLSASLVYYARGRNVKGVVSAAGGVLLAYVYLGLMFGFFLAIRREHSAWVLLWILLVIKACDIGAYFTGTAIGRHKLIPWLSPGKTWEGLLGGVATAAGVGAAGAAFSETAGIPFPVLWWHGMVFGAMLGLVGQAGDLLASLLKRDAGVKDYSQRLPGFGGVLDVIDSPLLVAPVAYWLLTALSVAERVRGS